MTGAAWRPTAQRVLGAIDPVRLLGLGLAVVVWELASRRIGSATFPGPIDTLSYLRDNLIASRYLVLHGLSDGGGFLPHLAYTIGNVISGVLAGSALGITLGLLSVRVSIISEIVSPLVGTFGAAPIVVAAPFFLIWFGIFAGAQFLIVAFYAAILMYIYSRRAGYGINPLYVESALTFGAQPWSIFRSIHLPASVPAIMAGFRIALAGSWGLEAIAELLGAQTGVGLLIRFYSGAFLVVGMLAIVLFLGGLAVMFDLIAVAIGRYLTRWAEAGHQLQL